MTDRPGQGTEAAEGVTHTTATTPILPRPLPAEAIAHAHAVLVSTPSGRYSRRLFLSLHSADKAMERARDRGQEAACVMVELVPVPGVPVIVVGGGDR